MNRRAEAEVSRLGEDYTSAAPPIDVLFDDDKSTESGDYVRELCLLGGRAIEVPNEQRVIYYFIFTLKHDHARKSKVTPLFSV